MQEIILTSQGHTTSFIIKIILKAHTGDCPLLFLTRAYVLQKQKPDETQLSPTSALNKSGVDFPENIQQIFHLI